MWRTLEFHNLQDAEQNVTVTGIVINEEESLNPVTEAFDLVWLGVKAVTTIAIRKLYTYTT